MVIDLGILKDKSMPKLPSSSKNVIHNKTNNTNLQMQKHNTH